MNRNVINYILIVIVTILSTKLVLEENSSPVEEIYHKQLVIVIDSILTARDCIEPDDISVKHDSLGRVIMPN